MNPDSADSSDPFGPVPVAVSGASGFPRGSGLPAPGEVITINIADLRVMRRRIRRDAFGACPARCAECVVILPDGPVRVWLTTKPDPIRSSAA